MLAVLNFKMSTVLKICGGCFHCMCWTEVQHCCLTSIRFNLNFFCLLYNTCVLYLFNRFIVRRLCFTGICKSLAFIVKCFIWIDVCCITPCALQTFSGFSMGFYHLMFTFKSTPEALVIRTLN